MSRDECQGALEPLRSAYDTRGLGVLSEGEEPEPEEFPEECIPEDPEEEPQEEPREDMGQEKPAGEGELIAALRRAIGSAVDEKTVRKIVGDEISKLPVKIEKIVVQNGKPDFKIEGLSHAALERVIRLVALRQHVYLPGPAGSGKTFLAEQAAQALRMNFASVSCSEGLSESRLLGWLVPIGEAGSFQYVPSDFVRIYETGGVFLFDEIDAADPNTLTVVNQALANGGFYLPQRHSAPYVERHKDFVAIAAGNTYGTGADPIYVGRNRLDGATLDRFRAGFTPIDYDPKLEEALSDPEILSWGRKIRAKIYEHKLRRIMSTRSLRAYTEQKAAGFSMHEIKESYFADWSSDERAKVGA